MANTTNLDLVKPAGTDQALISVLNGNSDKIDQFAGDTNTSLVSLADGMAIVANGDVHGAISSGQYVYVRNHTTLAEGLYTATSAIAANASLSTSNLTADSDGGFNSLSQAIANIKTAYTIGQSYTSLSALESALKTFGDSMQTDEVKNIKFTISSAIGVFPSGVYIGDMKRHGEGRYAVVVQRFTDDGTLFTGNYNSSWSWNSLNNSTVALTEYTDISSYNSDSNLYTIPSDGYVYLNVAAGNSGRAVFYGGSASASYLQMGNAPGRYTTFVRKGMRTYVAGVADTFRFVKL